MPRKDVSTEVQGIPRASVDTLRLVGMWTGGHVSRDLVGSGAVVIGRSSDADFVLDHPSVSRKHATLLLDSPIRIQDHGSANGTWVDGTKLEPHAVAPLTPGMVVELGATMVVLRGRANQPPEASAARSAQALARDAAMQEVNELIEVVAKSKLTVLLVGETGVGKDVLAARVHAASPRAERPFLKLNCAALVETLLESELFGHERGAFTGAVQAKPGLAEAASGGTLFLDEIGELSLSTQAKLLRLLESGEVTRVGARQPIAVDVRFVCATNRSLPAMVEDGRFRRDLYFRLDGLTVRVPPLRERPSEIGQLAQQFVEEAALEAKRPAPTLSREALERLTAHEWPGNVRELKNVIARSVLFCKGPALLESDLRIEAEPRSAAPVEATTPPTDKRARVLAALEKSMWNQTRAATALGISRRTLHNWLVELEIPLPRGGSRS